MRINHNIAALNTYRQLTIGGNNAAKAMEKLSSGLRINRAGDDAAGLAISEKMRGQIRGLKQAARNAQDGISLIQTAEGALNETHSILRECENWLLSQPTDSNTLDDRKEIQKEIRAVEGGNKQDFRRHGFNTQKLLNGSLGAAGQSADASVLQVVSVTGLKVGDYDVTVNNAATKASKTSGVLLPMKPL